MVLYSPSKRGFFEKTSKNIPPDCVEISYDRYNELLNGQVNGYEILGDKDGYPILSPMNINSPEDYKIDSERQWRNGELFLSDIELFKVQDSDPNAIGSVSDWRVYRKALRVWPEHEFFPNTSYRPSSPRKVHEEQN